MEVYELVSVLGMHTCTMGVPILLDEITKASGGTGLSEASLSPRQKELKETFIEVRGYWSSFWDGLLLLDPDFFEAFLNFSAVPWRNGPLEPKIKEFIYIAVDASTTHLYEPGLRLHIQNALRYGATQAEIMEVYELVSVLGMHTCTMGVPILLDEIKGEV
jgi:alkylhydroperoxidase/carboxymuconolactone decarboxylase family protein YurZ